MAQYPTRHWLGSLLWTFLCAIPAGALFGSAAMPCLGAGPDRNASEMTIALKGLVSLNGEVRSRRAALEDICRQAGVALRLDTEALTAAGLKLDELVAVKIVDEPLQDALARLVDWQAHLGVYRDVSDGVVFFDDDSGHAAENVETSARLAQATLHSWTSRHRR